MDWSPILALFCHFFFGLLALICAICGLFTPKVEVSGKEGKIPLSCSELFLKSKVSILPKK